MFKKPPTMTFLIRETESVSAKIREGGSVLATALRNKVELDSSCTEGTCGSCRVQVVSAPINLEPAHDVENETCRERGFRDDERLACQMTACENLVVRVPDYGSST